MVPTVIERASSPVAAAASVGSLEAHAATLDRSAPTASIAAPRVRHRADFPAECRLSVMDE